MKCFHLRLAPWLLTILYLLLRLPAHGQTLSIDLEDPKTPEDKLYAAVARDEVNTVRALLKAGINPNAPNSLKMPPLVEAADRGRESDIVALLLDYGADPNVIYESFHRTPLMAVVSDLSDSRWKVESQLKIIDLLLKRGANINLKVNEETALTVSMGYYADGKIVQALIARGADLTVPGHEKYTPLHYLACAGETAQVRQLLQSGADVNVRDTYGTPLFHAVMAGNTDTVRALLEAGADPNTRAYDDAHVLTLSFRHRSFTDPNAEIALLLVQAGANVNVKEKDGYGAETPLISALRVYVDFYRNAEVVDRLIAALLARGADVNAQDHHGTALMHAIERERLNRHEKNRQVWVQALLERGANVNAKTEYQTALHAAIDRERTSLGVPKLLLDRGADVNMTLSDQDTRTKGGIAVLLSALQQQDIAFAKLLVERGANIHCLDNAKKMPIHWAAFHGDKELVRMLLDRGANLAARDVIGQNALDLAIKGKQPEIAALLRARGAAKAVAEKPITNALGQVITRLPVKWTQGPVPPNAITFTAELKEETPGLLLKRGAEIIAEPVLFSALFTEPGLWPVEDRNNHLYLLQRGNYSTDAYQFSGLITIVKQTYLCVRWFSPASSIQNQIAYFVFELQPEKDGLKLTVLRKSRNESDLELTRNSNLPYISKSAQGTLLLADEKGTFAYQTDGTWKKIGPAPPLMQD